MFIRIFAFLACLTFPTLVLAQTGTAAGSENPRMTCEATLRGDKAMSECKRVFKEKEPCCLQYSEERLRKACARMPSVQTAISCFVEIHEVGFRKQELTGETTPGLAAEFAEQWKANSRKVCSSEPDIGAALDCVILQKSGIRFVYADANRKQNPSAPGRDPILQFCRDAFGEYWQGVEDCVANQKAAKRRMGL